MHPRRRFWRWGIWFWLVAWIVSMLVVVDLSSNLKGIAGIRMVVGLGSVGMRMNLDGGFSPNSIRVNGPEFIWSHPEVSADNAQEVLGYFGHAAWHDIAGYRIMPVVPVAGFLWLWLIGAWTDGFREVRWPGSFGSRRTLLRSTILISLPLLLLASSRVTHVKTQSNHCILKIRNIQQAVRSHQGMSNLREGGPMSWGEIFGPKKFMPLDGKKCPNGQPYRLMPHVPCRGELAAECPDSDHQRRIRQIDTSRW